MKVWIILALFGCALLVKSEDCSDNPNCPTHQIEEDCRHKLSSKWPNLVLNETVDDKEYCCSHWSLMDCYQINLCSQCGKTVADNATEVIRAERKVLESTRCRDYHYESLKCSIFQFWVIGTVFLGSAFLFSAICFAWNKFRK